MHTKSYFYLVVAALLLHFTSIAQTNSVTLKSGTTVISTHNGIISAYGAIPATLTQPYTIELDSSYHAVNDTFPIAFTNKAGASATNTITLTISDIAKQNSGVTITCNTTTKRMFVFNNADWVIIDGRYEPGSSGSLQLIGTGTQRELIQIAGGSSNNAIRRCFLMNTQYNQNGASCVRFGAGGNSRNRVSNCLIMSSPNAILSDGTIANPNNNITIANNVFNGVLGYAFKAANGTGRTLLDSNRIDAFPMERTNCIWYESHRDTAIITRNTLIVNNLFSAESVVKGIYFSNTVGTVAYAGIANNIIANTAQIFFSSVGGASVQVDEAAHVSGIEIAGANSIRADIYYNTIRFFGVTGSGSANALTVPFARLENHAGSTYNVMNNLFVNTRTGGGTGSKHLNVIMNGAGAVNMDYNTYEAAGTDMMELGTSTYSSLVAYKAASHEPNSDSTAIKFMSRENFHLAPSMALNPALQGIAVTNVGRDVDFQTRAWPYRGADEYAVACAGTLEGGEILNMQDSVCSDVVTILQVYNQSEDNGVVYQWQSRPAGSTANFTDIAGATDDHVVLSINTPTEFRFKDSCVAGGSPGYSDTVTLSIFPDVNVDSITETHTGFTYKFIPHGVTGAKGYLWLLGNNDISDSVSPTHTYSDSGVYNVRLIVSSDCGADSVDLLIHVQDPAGVNDIAENGTFKLYPNPSTGIVNLQLPGVTGTEVNIAVHSIAGQPVYEYKGNADKNEHVLNLVGVSKGIYIIRVQAGAQRMVQKLLLQ
jgi:hypothetical protein